ncbi:MAG: hypothetical protein HY758_08925 [Nitrospirae bacterium]|nr:hypothetical protein [Nitrospirota bacterium]
MITARYIFIATGRPILVMLTFLNRHRTINATAVMKNFIREKGKTPRSRKKAIIGFASITLPLSINERVRNASTQLSVNRDITTISSRVL